MPSTPFIGVRISWLMVARKALLARLAASAAFLARSSCSVRTPTWRSSSSRWWVSSAPRPSTWASMLLKLSIRVPSSSSRSWTMRSV
jgi:hypothetical protein